MALEIREDRVDDVVVLQLAGKLALGREEQRIESMTEELLQSGLSKIIFDITGVSYINSAGIGMLAMTAGRLKDRGGKLVLIASANGRTTQLLRLTQMHLIVPLCESMSEALAAFQDVAG